jgi:cyclase
MDRRSLLQVALGVGGCTLLPSLGRFAIAADALVITRVTERLSVISGLGGNVLVHAAAGGQVLVDSGAAAHTDTLLEALAGLPGGGAVQALFNTHWHHDHVGGNAALASAGAAIIAHVKTHQRLSVGYYLADEERYERPQPEAAWPTLTFFDRGELSAGDEQIEYGHLLLAHTDGDIYVRFRNANVIAVGDALSPARDPELDWFGGGWIGGRVDSLELLLDISDAATRFVPAHGPVVGRDALVAEHALMNEIYDRTQQMLRRGMSAEDMLEAGALEGLGRSFDDPRRFLHDLHRGLWGHHNKLSHDIV